MYFDLDDVPGRPYAGQSDDGDRRCPICGAVAFECPDAVAVPMPYPPVDIPGLDPADPATEE